MAAAAASASQVLAEAPVEPPGVGDQGGGQLAADVGVLDAVHQEGQGHHDVGLVGHDEVGVAVQALGDERGARAGLAEDQEHLSRPRALDQALDRPAVGRQVEGDVVRPGRQPPLVEQGREPSVSPDPGRRCPPGCRRSPTRT